MANTADQPFVLKVTCSSSDQSVTFPRQMHQVYLRADGDCFINIDDAVTASERFLLKANEFVTINDIAITTVHYKADTGTPALYIMAGIK